METSNNSTAIQQMLKNKNLKMTTSTVVDQRPILDIYQIIKLQFAKRSERQLGLLSYFARVYPSDKCGSNGLPLTPNSIRIYGKFQFLKTLIHKYLARYVDIQRSNHERLFVISEHYSLCLHDLLNDAYIYNLIIANQYILEKWTFQLLKAFEYLGQHQVVHRQLSLKNICITPDGNIKLSNYGLFFMSEYGFCVNFPVCNYFTLAPECLIMDFIYGNKFDDYPVNNGEQNIQLNNPKADVWSVGVVLFQFLYGIQTDVFDKTDKLIESSLNLLKLVDLSTSNSHDKDSATENDDREESAVGYEHLINLYGIDASKRQQIETKIKPLFMKLIKRCLNPNPIKRPSFRSLLVFLKSSLTKQLLLTNNQNQPSVERQELLDEIENENESSIFELSALKWQLFNSDDSSSSTMIRSRYLPSTKQQPIDFNSIKKPALKRKDTTAKETKKEEEEKLEREAEAAAKLEHLWRRDVDEVYFLWRLAGGDYLQTLKQNNRLLTKLMPIFKMPVLTTVEDGCEYGKLLNDEAEFDDFIVPLSLEKVSACLSSMNTAAFYPLLLLKEEKSPLDSSDEQQHDSMMSTLIKYEQSLTANVNEQAHKQPLNIRETYIEYQLHRMITFSRYLASYPFNKEQLLNECKIDIPPLYRALAWATLLDVRQDIRQVYERIDKESPTGTDRQIDLDVPRCHQYDPLMASPQAHYKLKRLLKAWVVTNPNLVYWQGLDSLTAPFMYLNFNNEALAYGCLMNFVKKYSARFFLKDNSAVVHEYLSVFSHLIAFHDAELASHFESIEFKPDLYAIPWYLTMFAHVFPLYKIFHLWDSLLLGNSSFPICVGVAILKQLRNLLLNSDFNDCILIFSELPEINMAKCVNDSKLIYNTTPQSCLYRQHSAPPPIVESSIESNKVGSNHHYDDDELDMSPIELQQMRLELCPRISARDVIQQLNSNDDDVQQPIILIDIRPTVEYELAYLPNSYNFPFESLNFAKIEQPAALEKNVSDSSSQQLVNLLQKNKQNIKIVLTTRSRFLEAVELANKLVCLKYNRVCLLNNGIECFKSANILLQQIH